MLYIGKPEVLKNLFILAVFVYKKHCVLFLPSSCFPFLNQEVDFSILIEITCGMPNTE